MKCLGNNMQPNSIFTQICDFVPLYAALLMRSILYTPVLMYVKLIE